MTLDLSKIDFRPVALEIATKAASDNRPSYYAEPFVPHEWVIDADVTAIRAGISYGVEIAAQAAATDVLRRGLAMRAEAEEIEKLRKSLGYIRSKLQGAGPLGLRDSLVDYIDSLIGKESP